MTTNPPPLPIFGGILHNLAWTGGKPTAQFLDTSNTAPETPYCYHNQEPKDAVKTYTARTQGVTPTAFTPKFSKTKESLVTFPLIVFIRRVRTHMEHTGMDSEFWFEDPMDSTMTSVIDHHAKFTAEAIEADIAANPSRYDSYSKTNLKQSAQALMNMLDDSFQQTLTNEGASNSGPVLWLQIVAHVETDSYRSLSNFERYVEGDDIGFFSR